MTLYVAQSGRSSVAVETPSVAVQSLNAHAWGDLRGALRTRLLDAPSVSTGTWQAQPVAGIPAYETRELQDVVLEVGCPVTIDNLHDALQGESLSWPWCEEHFGERVGGIPHNPPPSHVRWPHAKNGNAEHGGASQFSHTYPERFWPRKAANAWHLRHGANIGLRFRLGDYDDLVELLAKDEQTRQAYFPIWFPEDTGAHHGERVPCSLGYHFMVREGRMSVRYYLRSCDFVRHFTDDVYLALRLLQHTVSEVNMIREDAAQEDAPPLEVGHLVMHISSLHIFEGDVPKLEAQT